MLRIYIEMHIRALFEYILFKGITIKGWNIKAYIKLLKDSIYNIESIKAQNIIAIQLLNWKKEGEIALLEKGNEIQKAEQEKQKLIRDGFIYGFLEC